MFVFYLMSLIVKRLLLFVVKVPKSYSVCPKNLKLTSYRCLDVVEGQLHTFPIFSNNRILKGILNVLLFRFTQCLRLSDLGIGPHVEDWTVNYKIVDLTKNDVSNSVTEYIQV